VVCCGISSDDDNDLICSDEDNCPTDLNSAQDDSDADSIGDACDNCPFICNPNQLDADSDSIGDVCDESPGCGGCGQPACEVSCYIRFINNGDGTVTDTLTKLLWLQDADCFGAQDWDSATADAAELNSASNDCGLCDGSVAGDWRLPTKDELQGIGTNPPTTWPSLPGSTYPSVPWMMPSGSFIDVESVRYWASTMYDDSMALFLNISTGGLYHTDLSTSYYVWPVHDEN
jgi:hypothetical protein